MDPRAPLLGLTALLATPLGLAAPLQDEVPYEDPLDMDDPWAPFPLPELDLPESAPGRGDGLLLVDGRRWEGPVEVGDFATWWFTPPDGTPRRVHGDAVVLAEFEGELDYRGPDEVLVAAIAKGKDLDVREFAVQALQDYAAARAKEDAQRMLDVARAHGLSDEDAAALERTVAGIKGRAKERQRAPVFVREIEMQEGLIESWVETVATYRNLVDADGEPRPMLGPLLVQAALERYPDNAEFEQLRVDVLPDDFPFKGKYDAFEQWLAWGSLLQRTEARFAPEADKLREEAPGTAFDTADLVLESPNLIVLSHSTDAEMVGHTLAVGEATVRALAELLGDDLDRGKPLRIGVHKSRKMYLDEAGASDLVNTAGYYRPGDRTSRFFIPRGDAFDDGAAVRSLRKVVAHELTHQYLSERWRGGAGSGGPATPGYWVVEGFARFVEDQLWMEDRPEGRFDYAGSESLRACVKLAQRKKLFRSSNIVDWNQGEDFAGLDPKRANRGALGMTDVGRFYEQGGAMVFFFVNGGDEDRRERFFDYMWAHYQARASERGWEALGFEDAEVDGSRVTGDRAMDAALADYLLSLGTPEGE